jgi:lipid A 3-O-deacylase
MRNFVVVLTLLFAATAIAQKAERRSVMFRWENDSFGFITREFTDENYTNGLRFDVGSPGEHRWAQHVETLYCQSTLCGDGPRTREVSYGFTHQFYTPLRIDIDSRRPDRPWAGLMFGSATLRLNDGENLQHVLEGQLGVLGQAAGAHYLQSRWHQLIRYDVQPIGWPKQLRNEPIVNLVYAYNRRFPIGSNDHADVIASPGFALGTLTTHPSMSATLRFGHNVRGFPVGPIERTARSESRPVFEAYGLVGGDARYVFNNATLDGGFFRDGPSVERKNLVHDVRVGASFRVHSLRFSYTIVNRSAEFTERPSEQTFHSLALAFEP